MIGPITQRQQTEQIEASAKEFEGLFMHMMLKEMRQSIQKGGLVEGGNAEAIYTDMLDQEYAKIMASTNMSGLSEVIARDLIGKNRQDLPDKVGLAHYQGMIKKGDL